MLQQTLDNEESVEFRNRIRSFLLQKVLPHALDWEQNRQSPDINILETLGQEGFLGLSIPKKQGGYGKSFIYEVILAEELARSHALGWALSVLVQSNVVPHILSDFGTTKQQSIIKMAVTGSSYTALAATEKAHGSDLLGTSTSAKLKGDTYVLNGSKRYITNGNIASHLLVTARTKDNNGPWSHSLFLVPGNTKGLTRTRLRTTGLKTSDTAEIVLSNVVVPKNSLVGQNGKAFVYLLKGLQRERLLGGCALVSLAEQALEDVREELKKRERFGKPLSEMQALRHRISDLSSEIALAQSFTYQTIEKYLHGQPTDQDIAMIKLRVYSSVQHVVRECAQLLGAEAFIEEHWLAHAAQDVQAITVAAGTSEIMRELLATMRRD